MKPKAQKSLAVVGVASLAAFFCLRPAVPAINKPVNATLAQGSTISLRLNQAVGSKISSPGQKFAGKLAQPIVIDGRTVVPGGAECSGTVVEAVSAGRLAGGARLRIMLTSIKLEGKEYPIKTAPVIRVSQGKGKRTAEIAGGGAALGAAIGALAGGGKGALIGAAAGAGAGAVGSAYTGKVHEIVMPAESLISFRLAEAVTVTINPSPDKKRS
jgi:hypothetical protein